MPWEIENKVYQQSISVLQLKKTLFNVSKIQTNTASEKWACDRLYPELIFR